MIKINDKPEDISQRVFRFVLHTVQFAKRLQKDHTNLVMVNRWSVVLLQLAQTLKKQEEGIQKTILLMQ